MNFEYNNIIIKQNLMGAAFIHNQSKTLSIASI